MINYFLIEENGKTIIYESSTETKLNLKIKGLKVGNQFGILKYAQIWCSYANGLISQQQLRLQLNLD